jgi:hypothetical protein
MRLNHRYYTVLRLALPRTLIKDITFEGVRIPAKTVFFLNAWACNMGECKDPHLIADILTRCYR